jgi:hypothetical protein
MTIPDKQSQIVDLFFDLEQAHTLLAEMRSNASQIMKVFTRVYQEEDKVIAEGFDLPPRTPLDMTTRAAFTANLGILIPILDQLDRAIHWSQIACQTVQPELRSNPNLTIQ